MENMKDKGIAFPNLGANILLEAPTLGANNLFHDLYRSFLSQTLHEIYKELMKKRGIQAMTFTTLLTNTILSWQIETHLPKYIGSASLICFVQYTTLLQTTVTLPDDRHEKCAFMQFNLQKFLKNFLAFGQSSKNL